MGHRQDVDVAATKKQRIMASAALSPGAPDRAAERVQAAVRVPGQEPLREGKRDPDEGVQRAGGSLSSHRLRRCARAISRPHGTV